MSCGCVFGWENCMYVSECSFCVSSDSFIVAGSVLVL